jgi:hypothetical protein
MASIELLRRILRRRAKRLAVSVATDSSAMQLLCRQRPPPSLATFACVATQLLAWPSPSRCWRSWKSHPRPLLCTVGNPLLILLSLVNQRQALLTDQICHTWSLLVYINLSFVLSRHLLYA